MAQSAVPIFPVLRYGFPIVMRPVWSTIVAISTSGREVRSPQRAFPLYEFELSFEILKDQGPNWQPFQNHAGFKELQEILGFYNAMSGQYRGWFFEFPQDWSRQGQHIGTGDGSTRVFTVVRTIGLGTDFLTEPVGGVHALDSVYIGGALQNPNSYSWTGNQLTFATAPNLNAEVTADFSFYYKCRFLDDKQEFSEFMYNWWEIKTLKFQSIKP
jgi:hypothetical protein